MSDIREIAADAGGDVTQKQAWELIDEIDRLRAELAERDEHEPVVTEGYALVPKRMPFDAGDLQCLLFMSGDPHNEDEFSECFLWVGETSNVNGDTTEKRYGLNVTNSEYPEEGSTPFVEFARPPAPAAVPEEWKLVPVEPTEKMLRDAADNLCGRFGKNYVAPKEDVARAVWEEFVSAAPEPASRSESEIKAEALEEVAEDIVATIGESRWGAIGVQGLRNRAARLRGEGSE